MFNRYEFLIDTKLSAPKAHLSAAHESRITYESQFLTDNPAIRNRPKSSALKRSSVSNRPKKGISPEPVTHNLKPTTIISNRSLQELETDVTHCKQRTATGPNRNSQRRKAKGETTSKARAALYHQRRCGKRYVKPAKASQRVDVWVRPRSKPASRTSVFRAL